MSGQIILLYFLRFLTVLIGFCIVLFLLKQKRSLDLEKKFEQFALWSPKDYEESFFDIIGRFFWDILKKISKKLEKSVVLKKYSKRYEKYLKSEELEKFSTMNFITIKFILGFVMVLLYAISSAFELSHVEFPIVLLMFIFGFFILDMFLYVDYNAKRKRIEEDLLQAIMIMNNNFKSGRNIMQAVEIVANEIEGPISDEFKKIYMDMTYGLSLEVVFDRFYHRVKIEDANYITSSLTLLNKTGGNIVKVFDTIEKNFFNKKRIKEEMHSLTTSSVFVFRMLCVLPFIFVLAIYILNPTYFNPLFTTSIGRFLLGLVIVLYVLYIIVIKKVLEVKI